MTPDVVVFVVFFHLPSDSLRQVALLVFDK